MLHAATHASALNSGKHREVSPDGDKPHHRAPRDRRGAVDRIRLRQRLLKLQSDDVEEDHEPDGQIGMAGVRQEPRGYGDVTSVLPAMKFHSRGCARNRSRSCGIADSLKGRLRQLNIEGKSCCFGREYVTKFSAP